MAWPTSTDYNEAIQNPQVCFADVDLRAGQADGLMGLPQPFSGNFADVYKMMCAGGKNWAVKCFTREIQGLHARYQAISDHLQEQSRPFMVEFQYQDQGIKVKGTWFPIVKMSWVEGFALNQFVADHAAESSVLERLSDLWVKLAVQLREARMAHGDLQHGNVLLVPGSKANALALKLIDYDGMFVPSLADKPSGELGHRNYQHPKRKDSDAYDPEMDRFANLAIYTALRSVKVAGGLWSKYGDAENLLFRQMDFADPAGSTLLKELWLLQDRDARALTGHVVLASAGSLEEVPLLSELIGGEGVRPLNKEEASRVESLLFARGTVQRKSKFNPRAGQTAAKSDPARTDVGTAVPPLPSPLQPTTLRRRTPFPAPPVAETMPAPPPLPVLAAVPVTAPPPLPEPAAAKAVPPPLPALEEIALVPIPLEEARDKPAPRRPLDAAPQKDRGKGDGPKSSGKLKSSAPDGEDDDEDDEEDDEESSFFRDRPGLLWGGVGAVAVLLVGLLVWWLWPAKKPAVTAAPPPPQLEILHVDPIDLRGGDTATVLVAFDRKIPSGTLQLQATNMPDGVTCLPVNLQAKEMSTQLQFKAEQAKIKAGDASITLTVWAGYQKVSQSTVSLRLRERPMPRLINAKPLIWKIGETCEIDFEVDRQGNMDELALELEGCPRGVDYKIVRLAGGAGAAAEPRALEGAPDRINAEASPRPVGDPVPMLSFVRVQFSVDKDIEPKEDLVTLRLFAGKHPVLTEERVAYTVVRSALGPRLKIQPALTLPPRGPVQLMVTVVRQEYAGRIFLQVRGLPTGVKYFPNTVILEGETFVQLEFVTDGNPIVGKRTVEVIALVDDKVVDAKYLALQGP